MRFDIWGAPPRNAVLHPETHVPVLPSVGLAGTVDALRADLDPERIIPPAVLQGTAGVLPAPPVRCGKGYVPYRPEQGARFHWISSWAWADVHEEIAERLSAWGAGAPRGGRSPRGSAPPPLVESPGLNPETWATWFLYVLREERGRITIYRSTGTNLGAQQAPRFPVLPEHAPALVWRWDWNEAREALIRPKRGWVEFFAGPTRRNIAAAGKEVGVDQAGLLVNPEVLEGLKVSLKTAMVNDLVAVHGVGS